MKYRYLLIDNDNTLMDFHAAEHAALREGLTEAGIEPTDAVCARYSAINDALWKALERGETTHAALKIARFAQLLAEYPRRKRLRTPPCPALQPLSRHAR